MSNDRNWIWISFLSTPAHPRFSSTFLCVCIREFYFIALNLLFKQEKRFENLWNCVLLREKLFFLLFGLLDGREQNIKAREDYTDKFSLLETILIGFFLLCSFCGKKEERKLCHSGAFFLNNEKLSVWIEKTWRGRKTSRASGALRSKKVVTDWRKTKLKSVF